MEPNSSDLQKGVIIVGNALLDSRVLRDIPSQVVDTELDLLNTIVDLVLDLDPDIVSGWEVQSSSWGYLTARGQKYGLWLETTTRSDDANKGCRPRYWGIDFPCLWATVF